MAQIRFDGITESGDRGSVFLEVDANGNLQTSAISATGVAQEFIDGAAKVTTATTTKTAVFAEVTAAATPPGVPFGRSSSVFEASMVATDASSAIVTLFGTNETGDIANGVLLGTFNLSTAGAGTDKKFGPVTVPYLEVYGVVASVTGTTPAINLNWVG